MIFNLNKILSLLLILFFLNKKVILNNSLMYLSTKNFTKYIVNMPFYNFYLLNNDKKYKFYIFLISIECLKINNFLKKLIKSIYISTLLNKYNIYINFEKKLNIYNKLNSYIFSNLKSIKYIDIIKAKKNINNKKKSYCSN